MNIDDEDREVLQAWRHVMAEMPGTALDAKVLAGARAWRTRRRLLPVALALAASVVALLVWNGERNSPMPHSGPPDAGLYEGRAASILADPEAMRQIMIRQMPGGDSTSEETSL